MAGFPEPQPGVLYLTEGGQETELMYKHGHELPEFAMYPLLDDRRAVADLTDMYTRYLEVAAAHGFVALMGGLDYRASPDWASKLGISRDGLAEFQLRSIAFLREVARPFEGQIPQILVAGIVGPRGDAYGQDRTITADEAEDYHGVQIETLRQAGVDLVSAMTFNNIPEAVGVARAAANAGLPLSLSFMVDSAGRLRSGPIAEGGGARRSTSRPATRGRTSTASTARIRSSSSRRWSRDRGSSGCGACVRTRRWPRSRRCARSGTSRPAILSCSARRWARSLDGFRTSTSGAAAAGPGTTTSRAIAGQLRALERAA